MNSNWRKPKNEDDAIESKKTRRVVKIADARAARLKSLSANDAPAASSAVNPRETLEQTVAAARELLDHGMSREAETRLRARLNAEHEKRSDPKLLAEAHCTLSVALETQGRYADALEAIVKYEATSLRARLDLETDVSVRVQLGLSLNYTGDHPKAIALLNATLRQTLEASERNSIEAISFDSLFGAIYAALARIYRHIHEYPIARDFMHKAATHFRITGEWRGLAEVYWGLGGTDIYESKYENCIENYEQALKIIGDHPAPFMRGRIYASMAAVCYYLRRPHEGIRNLEKAISYYETTEHKSNASIAYNNLGNNLMVVGEWDRAQAAFERSLALIQEITFGNSKIEMLYDSLGELLMARGDLSSAREYLERAVAVTQEIDNKWHTTQIFRNYARCLFAFGELETAREWVNKALEIAEKIGDRNALNEAQLIIAEIDLRDGKLNECAALLQRVSEEIGESSADLSLAGETQRVSGELALVRHDGMKAVHHFGRSVSIQEMIGDRYRVARALDGLGRAYAVAQPERAAEHLKRAAETFREIGARLALSRTEESINALAHSPVPERAAPAVNTSQLLMLRLAEAAATSRTLLLRELAAVLQQETGARQILIAERDEEGGARTVVAHNCSSAEQLKLTELLCRANTDAERKSIADEKDAAIITLRATNVSGAQPALLYLAPRASAQLSDGAPLDPLLRVVELGLTVCALRERAHGSFTTKDEETTDGENIMPGFVHSSPAMTRLVEEIHKIRSSDVTVLVTGESGTGKELVARAIHTLSSRREKIFVPFNCTAVPKELTEGYLFGYRRGAFTGAVHDSPGVIRSAQAGTLFLDEVGDLPLDVQPKILRFLQEGEIQPLGEQRPVQVDVRIIAATNNDLEKMVADGRFREDLYYRLNVIRLLVPPLRERRSEIPAIVSYYINHYSAKFKRRDIEITPQAVDLMMVHTWTGNVRELCNELQRIIARAENGARITPDQLSPELRRATVPTQYNSAHGSNASPESNFTILSAASSHATNYPTATAPLPENLLLSDALSELEQRMITEALRKHRGNISRAARELGLTRRGLYLKLERYNLSIT